MTRWDKSLLAMMAACALTACSASHETARQVASTDSLQVESRWRLATTTVPESRVELAIPAATLRTLPATGLADHQGQATARVRWRHDTLYVAATCDSLRRLVQREGRPPDGMAHLGGRPRLYRGNRDRENKAKIALSQPLFIAPAPRP